MLFRHGSFRYNALPGNARRHDHSSSFSRSRSERSLCSSGSSGGEARRKLVASSQTRSPTMFAPKKRPRAVFAWPWSRKRKARAKRAIITVPPQTQTALCSVMASPVGVRILLPWAFGMQAFCKISLREFAISVIHPPFIAERAAREGGSDAGDAGELHASRGGRRGSDTPERLR